ncbi:MAG: hypothetical protein WC836_13725 [Desulfobacula sp.]|jgi:hypothetical protein
MNLREQLPYLGEKQAEGTLSIAGFQIERPDYKTFLSKQYQKEAECVSILLGVRNIRSIEFKIKKVTNIFQYRMTDKFVKLFLPPDISEERNKITESYSKMTFFELRNGPGKTMFDLYDLMNELRDDINNAIRCGHLKRLTTEAPYDFERDNQGTLFSQYYVSYDRVQFLKWAGDNGYPIPKEISSGNSQKQRNDQQDKQSCQKIAKSEWKKNPELAIKYMIKHPMILKACGPKGKRHLKKNSGPPSPQYKPKTLRTWISEVAPTEVKKQGRLSKDSEERQLKICEKLGIIP